MKSIHSIYIALFVIIFCPFNAAFAHERIEDNAGYCQNAKTTADLVACTKVRLDAENQRVDQLFKAVQAVYKDENDTKAMITANQASWLAYRDTVCAVEAKQYEGGSLAIVQETSCLARVTSDRANHYLVMLRARDDAAVPVFSNPPRWVNVLGDDYKDVFWALSSKHIVDTDCDGTDEVLLSGLRQGEDGQYQNILAIADSNKTGRPKTSLIKFDDIKQCDIIFGMTIKPNTVSNDTNSSCRETVSFSTQNCGEFTLDYDMDKQIYFIKDNSKNEADNNESKN